MAKVEFDDVSKVYADGTRAVDKLELQVVDGEFMVLVGPSGCGKTTALRMVAGLEEISEGVVRIGERVVNDLTPKNRDIAMVFQSYALYPHLSVHDNIAFPLKLAKLRKPEIGRRIGAAAGILGLEPYLGRKPRALSGGQRQRVAMGRAIVREPKAFLMDEPLSNLDAKLRVQMRADIKKLQTDLEATTIYVTHDQVEAMTMGDRVAVMRKGKLQQVAPPEELYEHPVNVFVAGFIGSPAMNILQARVEAGAAVVGDARFAIPGLEAYDGRDVLVGIRPESFDDAALVEADGRPRLTGRVELREALGSEVLVHFSTAGRVAATDELRELAADAGDDRAAERATLVGRFSPKTRVRQGDTISVAVDVDAVHAFDPKTGLALQQTRR
jgi:multiple sugar transport system ATP-binding protein